MRILSEEVKTVFSQLSWPLKSQPNPWTDISVLLPGYLHSTDKLLSLYSSPFASVQNSVDLAGPRCFVEATLAVSTWRRISKVLIHILPYLISSSLSYSCSCANYQLDTLKNTLSINQLEKIHLKNTHAENTLWRCWHNLKRYFWGISRQSL